MMNLEDIENQFKGSEQEGLEKSKLKKILTLIKDDKELNKILEAFENKYEKYDIKKIDFSEIELKEKVEQPSKDSSYKIVYAMAWKNGDLGKEEPILKGYNEYKNSVYSEYIPNKSSNISVFYQFGRFLKSYSEAKDGDFSKVEPIADQHTFRAYLYFVTQKFKKNELPKDVIPQKFAKKGRKPLEENYWEKYLTWYTNTVRRCDRDEKYFWDLNKIMFVLGKAIKP